MPFFVLQVPYIQQSQHAYLPFFFLSQFSLALFEDSRFFDFSILALPLTSPFIP